MVQNGWSTWHEFRWQVPYRRPPKKKGQPQSKVYWFRKVVPEEPQPIVGQSEFKVSLRTEDLEEAKKAFREAADRVDAILAGARAKLLGTYAALSLREITAAVGVAYREEAARWADEPGTAEHWDEAAGVWADYFQPDEDDEHGPRSFRPDKPVLEIAEGILSRQGIVADKSTIRRTAEVWAREQLNFALAMEKRCDGDWHTSTGAERFPDPAQARSPATEASP